MSLQVLCNSNKNAKIKISAVTREGEINSIVTTVNKMLKQNLYMGQDGARLILVSFQMIQKPTFVDYLRSGWQVSLVTAIDFTSSNGNPATPGSLHYLGPGN